MGLVGFSDGFSLLQSLLLQSLLCRVWKMGWSSTDPKRVKLGN